MAEQMRRNLRRLAQCVPPALALSCALGAVTARAADAGYCQQYATTALEQFEEAAAASCNGLKYPVWSMDFDHHYQWCLTVPVGQAQAGTAFRKKVFDFCMMTGRPLGGTIVIPLGTDDDDAHATPDQIPQPQ